MARCEFFWRCSGLSAHLSHKPVLESIYRQHYCEEDGLSCARYRMAQTTPMEIPDDLLPNQHDRLLALGLDASGGEGA